MQADHGSDAPSAEAKTNQPNSVNITILFLIKKIIYKGVY